jgi:RimJ/RimL family protein N-acetyltransferase
MPRNPSGLSFEPVRPEHYPLLRRWLESPHVRTWWGDPDEEFGFIRDMVEGSDTTRPFLIVADGEPIGYIQYWFIGHHQNEEWLKDNPWLAELPSNAVGVDLSIGEPELLSKGLGSAALRAFVEMLRRNGVMTIVIDPDPDNLRAVRAYRKAGFEPIPHLQNRTPGVLIMQHQLQTAETSI